MTTRTFIYTDAKSNKFWSIQYTPGTKTYTVTYGKVGTAGQTAEKSFPDAAACQKAADKLIAEKTGKGYVEQPDSTNAIGAVTNSRNTAKVHSSANAAACEKIQKAASLFVGLMEHFAYLADTTGFDAVLFAITAKAEAVKLDGTGNLVVVFPDNKLLTCSAPGSTAKYKKWPKSFTALLDKHEHISFPDNGGWALNLGDTGSLETSMFEDGDSDLLSLVDDPEDILCPFADYSDWWIYHPKKTNPQGEPVLCLASHESGDIEEERQYNIGSLMLARMAETLELEVDIPEIKPAAGAAEDKTQTWFSSLNPQWQDAVAKLLDNDATPEKIEKLLQEKRLYLSNIKTLSTLSGIESFHKLEKLTAHKCPIEDFSPLAALPNLKELMFGGETRENLQALSKLTHLEKLIGLNLTALKSLDGVETLLAMKEFTVGGCEDLQNIDALKSLNNLTDVDFSHCKLPSLEALRGLPGLKMVKLYATNITDLSPLHGKPIVYFECKETPVTFVSIIAFLGTIPTGLEVNLSCDSYFNSTDFIPALKTLGPLDERAGAALVRQANIHFRNYGDKYKGTKKIAEAKAIIKTLVPAACMKLFDK